MCVCTCISLPTPRHHGNTVYQIPVHLLKVSFWREESVRWSSVKSKWRERIFAKGAKDATGREKRAEYNAAHERKPGRDVCATYSAVIRSPAAALHSVYPRQIPLDTILSLLYTLSCAVIHRDSSRVEGWRCSFPNTQETIRKTTRIKLDIVVCDLVEIYAIWIVRNRKEKRRPSSKSLCFPQGGGEGGRKIASPLCGSEITR